MFKLLLGYQITHTWYSSVMYFIKQVNVIHISVQYIETNSSA